MTRILPKGHDSLLPFLKLFNKTVHTFFGSLCYACAEPLKIYKGEKYDTKQKEGSCKYCFFCKECLDRLSFVEHPVCPACGGNLDGILDVCTECLSETQRPWSQAVTLMRFENMSRELIHRFKFGNAPELAYVFGCMAAEKIKSLNLKADFIEFIPLHWTRYIKRGYNQAGLFARVISRETAIPIKHVLNRRKRTSSQSKLSKQERKKNIKDAFFLSKKQVNIKNKTILLVDDVFTTGATLTSATELLLDGGVADVKVCTIARG